MPIQLLLALTLEVVCARFVCALLSKGKGKSGGARVITVTVIAAVDEREINLLYLYDKSERGSITRAEIESLLKDCGLSQILG